LSAVLLVIAVRLLIVEDSSERRIEALCLGVMMASLLVQGTLGSDKTISLTTLLFFSSLVVFVYIKARRRPGRRSM
jgi:hypothetical protein